jgi:hypothetical protein
VSGAAAAPENGNPIAVSPVPQAAHDERVTARDFLLNARRAISTGRLRQAREAVAEADEHFRGPTAQAAVPPDQRNAILDAVDQARTELAGGHLAAALTAIDAALTRIPPPGR